MICLDCDHGLCGCAIVHTLVWKMLDVTGRDRGFGETPLREEAIDAHLSRYGANVPDIYEAIFSIEMSLFTHRQEQEKKKQEREKKKNEAKQSGGPQKQCGAETSRHVVLCSPLFVNCYKGCSLLDTKPSL